MVQLEMAVRSNVEVTALMSDTGLIRNRNKIFSVRKSDLILDASAYIIVSELYCEIKEKVKWLIFVS